MPVSPEKSAEGRSKILPFVLIFVLGLLFLIGSLFFLRSSRGTGSDAVSERDSVAFLFPVWIAVFLPVFLSRSKENIQVSPRERYLLIGAVVAGVLLLATGLVLMAVF